MTESVQWAHSTCPHDCPSTCALEVEVVDSKTIGRVRGRKGHPYTDGVICGKVSRYADRVHHPNRLMQPLKRIGRKGVGIESYTPISCCLLYTSPSPRDRTRSRMPSSA